MLHLSFRTLFSLFWLVLFGIFMGRFLHGNSKFLCRVLFPPVPASGLTSYTGLSSPIRLTNMWIWSYQCERCFPGPPHSLRLRTRTLSPCSNIELRTKRSNVVWLVCLLHRTSCLLIRVFLSLLFATFRAAISVLHMVQVFCPTWFLGLWQGREHS